LNLFQPSRATGKHVAGGFSFFEITMPQFLGYPLDFTRRDSFVILEEPNTGARFYCDRLSVLHGEVMWPLPDLLYRFNTVPGSPLPKAVDLVYEMN
jgi:hypothetical protein